MKTWVLLLTMISLSANAADTTPFNCEHMAANFIPFYRQFCDDSEADMLQRHAHILGRPSPSRIVVDLPAQGSPDAKRYGVACIDGMAMIRLVNGWKQANDRQGNWLRCRVQPG